jgi:hypothetical protein
MPNEFLRKWETTLRLSSNTCSRKTYYAPAICIKKTSELLSAIRTFPGQVRCAPRLS